MRSCTSVNSQWAQITAAKVECFGCVAASTSGNLTREALEVDEVKEETRFRFGCPRQKSLGLVAALSHQGVPLKIDPHPTARSEPVGALWGVGNRNPKPRGFEAWTETHEDLDCLLPSPMWEYYIWMEISHLLQVNGQRLCSRTRLEWRHYTTAAKGFANTPLGSSTEA